MERRSTTRSEQGRRLSLSLPFMPGNIAHRGPHVRAWSENLLPDSKDTISVSLTNAGGSASGRISLQFSLGRPGAQADALGACRSGS
jgi:hypothetical protein